MAVTIRLNRVGRKNLPFYHISVSDHRRARSSGNALERIGFYNPNPVGKDVEFTINAERLEYWVAKGAQVSDTVSKLIAKRNVGPAKVHKAVADKIARRVKALGAISGAKQKAEEAKAAFEAKKAAAAAAPAEAPSA